MFGVTPALVIMAIAASFDPPQAPQPSHAHRFSDVVVLPGGTEWAAAFSPRGAPASVASGVLRFGDATPEAPVSRDLFGVDPAVFGRVEWPRLLLVDAADGDALYLWSAQAHDHAAGKSRVVAEWSSTSGFATAPPCVLATPEHTRVAWACRITTRDGSELRSRPSYALGGVRSVHSSGARTELPWIVLLERGPSGLVPLSAERSSPSVAAFSRLMESGRVHVGLNLDVGRPVHALLVQRADEGFELWRLMDGALDRVELSAEAEAFLRAGAREDARFFPFVGATGQPLLVAAAQLPGWDPHARLTVHGVAGPAGVARFRTRVEGIACAATTAGDGTPMAVFSADSAPDCGAWLVRAGGIQHFEVLTGEHCDVLGTDWGERLWLSPVGGTSPTPAFRLLAARTGAFHNRGALWSHSLEFQPDGAPRTRLLAIVDRLGQLSAP